LIEYHKKCHRLKRYEEDEDDQPINAANQSYINTAYKGELKTKEKGDGKDNL
jgi:hypothetical protein